MIFTTAEVLAKEIIDRLVTTEAVLKIAKDFQTRVIFIAEDGETQMHVPDDRNTLLEASRIAFRWAREKGMSPYCSMNGGEEYKFLNNL